MNNISDHISYAEATVSQTASRLGIDNKPNPAQLVAMQLVAKKCFEPLRNYAEGPLKVTSFFRCPELNIAIGGAKNSDHCLGMAIDIQSLTPGKTNAELFYYCRQHLQFKQLIWEFGTDEEPDWIHISYDPNNLKQESLVATRIKGKTVYTRYV